MLTKDWAFLCGEDEVTDFDFYLTYYLISHGLQYPTSSCAYGIDYKDWSVVGGRSRGFKVVGGCLRREHDRVRVEDHQITRLLFRASKSNHM